MIVARYRTGPEFAVLYSHVRFYQDCHDPTPDTANVGFTVPDYIPQEGTPEQTSTGQIAYLCDGGKRVAYAYVRTVSNGGIGQYPRWAVISAQRAGLHLHVRPRALRAHVQAEPGVD